MNNGRLIVPVWLSTSEGGNPHKPSVAATIYSDDHGTTWRRGDIAVHSVGDVLNPNETAAVELAGGKVMLNVRSRSSAHRRIVVVSKDGASGWSAPRFQKELLEPVCFGSLTRHGGAVLFVNPHNLERSAGPADPGQRWDETAGPPSGMR